MKAKDFEVGDRVIVSEFERDGKVYTNEKAKVIEIDNNEATIGLEFYNYVYGHDCGGSGKDGYCLWFSGRSTRWNISKVKIIDDSTEKDTPFYEVIKPKRKVIQICGSEILYVLCEDGTMLAFDRSGWAEIPEIPQDN